MLEALIALHEHRRSGEVGELDAMVAEIARLTESLADPALFARDLAKLRKVSKALSAAQAALARAEEQWLELAERAES